MKNLSTDLKRHIVNAYRIVNAYKGGHSVTYEQTARIFGISQATVSRLLRQDRETGVVASLPKGGNHARRIDLDWRPRPRPRRS